MARDDPITKDDLRELRKHIDGRFDRQDNDLASLRRKINAEGRVNAEQAIKIDALEKDVSLISGRMWKAVAAGCGVAILAVWDAFIKGNGAS